MKTIAYRIVYAGTIVTGDLLEGDSGPGSEIVRVQALTINSGFAKALQKAREPLGDGRRRQVHSIEFWQVVS